MKNTVFLFSLCLFFTANSLAQLTQFWNYQNQENAATNGLYYDHEANIGVNFPHFNATFFEPMLLGSYSTYLEKHKVGVGVNFEHLSTVFPQNERYNVWNLKLAANRQFLISKSGILSAGLGLGARKVPLIGFLPNNTFTLTNQQFFSADFGLAFRWKKLNLAASYNHFLGDQRINNKDWLQPYLLTFASYEFRITNKIDLTPNVGFIYQKQFGDFRAAVNAQFKKKYLVGLGVGAPVNFNNQQFNNEEVLVTLGYKFQERFRFSYAYATYLSKVNNSIVAGRHELGFALLLRKRNL